MTSRPSNAAPGLGGSETPLGMHADHPSVAWYQALRRIRAKAILRDEVATNAEAVVVAIAQDRATTEEPSQRGSIVQLRALTDNDRRVVAALERRTGIASAKAIARDADLALGITRRRLDRLIADGRVENVPGKGYRLVKK